MTYFITVEELKQTTFNANLDNEYITPALEEAQSIYLREIIGDLLYNSITSKIDEETLSGKYLTLVNQYIKPYLTYKVQSVIVIPLNNKTRNAGIINQYDQGFNTSTMKDTAYLADYYNSRAEFYANRLTTYLQKNAADFPEYGYSDDNITQPTETQNVTTLFLGGGRKKGCGCNTTPQATATTVEWDNITNRPDFAQVAYSNDYNDLDNKPEIPSLEGYATETWVQQQGYSTFDGDYNNLTNKPTIPTVPTNVSAFTNDAGYTTFDGDYNSLTNKPTIPAAQVNSDWNANSGVSQILNKPDLGDYVRVADYNVDKQSIDNTLNSKVDVDTYNNKMSAVDTALADKVETGNLCRINNERLDTNSNFELVRTDSIATLTITQGGTTKGTFTPDSGTDVTINLDAGGGGGSTDWSDITNKPNFATVATSGDYNDLTSKPTIPTVPTNVSAFTNDAGYLTQHQDLTGYATETWVGQQGYSTFSGDYNDLTNKPSIPAAQVNSDWNANSGVAQILNKPSLATVATSGDYTDLTNKPTIPAAPVQSDWNQTDNTALDYIKNKPTVPSGQIQSDWNQTNTSSVDYIKNKPSLFSGDYNDLTNKPTIPAAQVNSDWNASTGVSQILNKPSLATVATSGDYDDLQNKPTIPAAQVQTDWNAVSGMGQILNKPSLATVATTGSYSDLTNKPTIPAAPVQSNWNESDTNSLAYIQNKPTIPAAQVQTDWNANSGMGQLLNKPSMTTETWTFTLSDNSTVTKTVWLQPTV